jgi:small subunit ribosomal protein S5
MEEDKKTEEKNVSEEKIEETNRELSEPIEKTETNEENLKKDERPKVETREERQKRRQESQKEEKLTNWVPKTNTGKEVLKKKIKNIDEILDSKSQILEDEIIDYLLKVESDLLFTGQSKGKFGGGKRRAWRQTQKKTKEGNVVTFSALAVVGDKKGHVGIGLGKATETLPAREKALRKAKLSLIKINRGSGSFEGSSDKPHSIPFKVEGKCGSCKIVLIPAPQGTGLVIGREGKRILRLAGIEDIYSKSFGQTKSTINYSRAIMDALKKLQ